MASYQLQWKRRCLSLLPWLLHLMVEEMQRHLELFALLMFSSRAAGFSRELWWFCMCFCIVLVLAAVRKTRDCFLTMFTYCVRLVCHSFAVSYFHRKTKMLPHKWFKCGRGIFNTNFTLTLHHADITTHDETTFHLDEKSRRVLISRDLVIRDLVTPLVGTMERFFRCESTFCYKVQDSVREEGNLQT